PRPNGRGRTKMEFFAWGCSFKKFAGSPEEPAMPPLGQLELEVAELLDRGDQRVAGLEPDLLVLRIARDHALRRAGENEIAGLEREIARRVAHELLAVEHHVGRVRRLAPLAVD